ncbi:hypothetical protein [Roseobacter sp.]|uniref:hypothetical protein n=1 Tax=Roseobacter sp. TaxID=1907202 RepID=UPI00385E2F1A
MTELIRLSDESGKILPYARQLLDALAFFPDDELSFKICRFAIEREYQEYLKRGPDVLKVSLATAVLINAAEKRAQQVHVAGLVALAIFGLKSLDRRPSQEAAVERVAKHNSMANKFPFERWDYKSGKHTKYDKAVQCDVASVRQIFTMYRSVAHICAARVSSTDYLQPLSLFEPSKQADESKLATVLAFQAFFQTNIVAAQNWNMRLIEFPASLQSNPVVLEPERALMEALLKEET